MIKALDRRFIAGKRQFLQRKQYLAALFGPFDIVGALGHGQMGSVQDEDFILEVFELGLAHKDQSVEFAETVLNGLEPGLFSLTTASRCHSVFTEPFL